MLALSIFTCSHPHTIVDGTELNFCVRDGNRWTLRPINTNLFEASCIFRTSIACPYIRLSEYLLYPEN